MAKQFSARKNGSYIALFSTPDVCKIANGTPVPFPILEKLSNSVKVAKTCRFNHDWAFMLRSHTTKVTGDEPGVNKGVKSQTVGEKAEPIEHSKSVRIEGSWLVRVGDKVYMNSKNTIGTIVFMPPPQMGTITDNGEIDIAAFS